VVWECMVSNFDFVLYRISSIDWLSYQIVVHGSYLYLDSQVIVDLE
jgi:hypothetical protein